MERLAFKMKLVPGFEKEYIERHDNIWPDLKILLSKTGISEYSIFLDAETNSLFGVLKINNHTSLNDLSHDPLMKLWWEHMKDIMETNSDHSPASIPLKEVFYLP